MEPAEACRRRVYEFEKETEKNLDSLKVVEEGIANVSKLRKAWLDSVSRVDDFEVTTVTKKLELLRIRADTYITELMMDGVRLEGYYEAQHLKYMVVATSPCDPGETKEMRKALLAKIARDGVEELKHALQQSVEYRVKLGLMCDALSRELKATLSYYSERQGTSVEELKVRVLQYIEKLEVACEVSRKNYKAITAEYLVLRHNARVAKEILVRKQNESSMERERLQGRMEALLGEAHQQRQRMEESANDELRVLTNDVRNELMKNEVDLRAAIKVANEKKSMARSSHLGLKRSIREYETKYADFEASRKVEVRDVLEEISKLRGLMHDVQHRLVDGKINEIKGRAERGEADVCGGAGVGGAIRSGLGVPNEEFYPAGTGRLGGSRTPGSPSAVAHNVSF